MPDSGHGRISLAWRAELPLPTAHRLVAELTAHGLLRKAARGDVRLGLRLWELAVRRAQNLSDWMTSLLHARADTGSFERQRALGELNGVVSSRHGSAYLAEACTGWPSS